MSVSQTAVTNAGHLKVRDVIHVVGPRVLFLSVIFKTKRNKLFSKKKKKVSR